MDQKNSVPIISAILFKEEGGEIYVYLQERWKPKVSPNYSGLIEIPAGVIDPYENVYDTLRREVKEECGLDIVRIVNNFHGEIEAPRKGDKSFVFSPFVCQQALETNNGLPWVGFVFLCEVAGKLEMQASEARNPRWLLVEDLSETIENKPESFFPLQLPVLKYFLNYIKEKGLS